MNMNESHKNILVKLFLLFEKIQNYFQLCNLDENLNQFIEVDD